MKNKIFKKSLAANYYRSILFYSVLFLFISISLNSCKKDIDPMAEDGEGIGFFTDPTGEVNHGVLEKMTELGEQLCNPYNIDRMRQASINVRGNDGEIYVSHLYIRFEPSTLDELLLLDEDTTLFLSDVPLDYEILVEGEYYHDPNIGDEDITYYYSSIAIGDNIPAVPYKILDELYIPDADKQEDIEIEAFNLCGIPYEDDGSKGRKKPNGTITVDYKDGREGLSHVKVIAHNWFRWKQTYTDKYGYFSFDKKFRKVKVKVKFKTFYSKVRVVRKFNVYRMLTCAKIKLGKFKGGDVQGIKFNFDYYSDITTKGAENWYCARAHNGIMQTLSNTISMGLPQLPLGMNVYVTSHMGESAAPMLSEMVASPNYTVAMLTSKIIDLTNIYVYAAVGNIANLMVGVFQKRLPDIIIGMTDGKSMERVEKTIFHELGHGIHYVKAGEYFWSDEIDYIIANYGYGTKSTLNSGICAVTESWGNFFEIYSMYYKYGSSDPQWLIDLDETIGNGYSWFPVGMYWDLYDDEATYGGAEHDLTGIFDYTRNISIPSTFNLLTDDCRTPIILRTKLINNYPAQQTEIITIFNSYGY